MATRKTPAKTAAGKTVAKSATTPRKRAAAGTAQARSKTPAAAAEAAPTRTRVATKVPPAAMSAEERYRAIAHAAYLRAEKRGFAPGHEVEDWLVAEADFDAANKPVSE